MKLFLLATYVTIISASTLYRGKNIFVNRDGSIQIDSSSGNSVVITKGVGIDGRRTIDIFITGPNIPAQKIQIDDENTNPWTSINSLRRSWVGSLQGDVLRAILKEYQGAVSEALYEDLLAKVKNACKNNQIDWQIYELLAGLDQLSEGVSLGLAGAQRGYLPGNVIQVQGVPVISQKQQVTSVVCGLIDQYGNSLCEVKTVQNVNPRLTEIYYQQEQTKQAEDLLTNQELASKILQENLNGNIASVPLSSGNIVSVPLSSNQRQLLTGGAVLVKEYLLGAQKVPFGGRQTVGQWNRMLMGRPVYRQPIYKTLGLKDEYGNQQGLPINLQNQNLEVPQALYF